MSPTEVVESMREYTNNFHGVELDTIILAQSTISDIVGFILGLIAFFIAIGMGVITALDIAYITIPMFQDKVRDEKWDGSRGHGKVRFISNNARIAVERASTQVDGNSALKIYLKGRVLAYVISAVVLYICLAGTGVVVPIIARIVSEILNAFGSISIG